MTSYRERLKSELRRRMESNPHYSMSAFARQLGVGKATLSDVLNGKRDFSPLNVRRVAHHLQLPAEEYQQILSEIREARMQRAIARSKETHPTAQFHSVTGKF